MLILKGDCGKSVVIDILMDKTNSICFVYHDYPLIYNSICLSSLEYSLNDLKECILDELKASDNLHYDYIIVYTNKKEECLKDFIEWLGSNSWCCFAGNIIVTCK